MTIEQEPEIGLMFDEPYETDEPDTPAVKERDRFKPYNPDQDE